MSTPVHSTGRPVGGRPRNGPRWVPRKVQRSTTLSPSAISSSGVIRASGKASVIPAKARRIPSRSASVQHATAISISFALRASIQCRIVALFSAMDMGTSSRERPAALGGGTPRPVAGAAPPPRLAGRPGRPG